MTGPKCQKPLMAFGKSSKIYCYRPKTLTRNRDVWSLWQVSNLLLAQTCGLPFRQILCDKVNYVASPDYATEGYRPGYYKSIFISGKEQSLSSAVRDIFAFSQAFSESGWAGPMISFEKPALSSKKYLKNRQPYKLSQGYIPRKC